MTEVYVRQLFSGKFDVSWKDDTVEIGGFFTAFCVAYIAGIACFAYGFANGLLKFVIFNNVAVPVGFWTLSLPVSRLHGHVKAAPHVAVELFQQLVRKLTFLFPFCSLVLDVIASYGLFLPHGILCHYPTPSA